MSLYTTEVRYICEEANGQDESSGGNSVNDILANVWDKVFPQAWPIFDEEYRSVLCQKILKHYYTREIGFETVGLWKLKLETKMAEIMPYYNELYKTTILEYDPFKDVDYHREHEGESNGLTNENDESTRDRIIDSESNGRATGSNSGTQWNIFSDTPQGALTNVENETYLTDARKINTENQNENETYQDNVGHESESGDRSRSANYNNTDEYLEHVYGKMGHTSYMKLIKELRDNIVNIDVRIIDELKDLFMLLWA